MTERGVAELAAQLDDGDSYVRERAVRELGRIVGSSGESVARILMRGIQDPEAAVREAAITALAGLRSVEVVRQLGAIALQERSAYVREAAVRVLRDMVVMLLEERKTDDHT